MLQVEADEASSWAGGWAGPLEGGKMLSCGVVQGQAARSWKRAQRMLWESSGLEKGLMLMV